MAQAPGNTQGNTGNPSGGFTGMMANAFDNIFGKRTPGQRSDNQQRQPGNNGNNGNSGVADPVQKQDNALNPGNQDNQNIGRNADGQNLTGQTLQKGEQSPLDEYADLLTIEDKSGQQQQEEIVNFDEKKFTEALGKMDFSKGINPELMTKALSGDQAAFAEILNGQARNIMGLSGKMAVNLVKNATSKTRSTIESSLPGQIQNNMIRSNVLKDNPAFNHPLISPYLDVLSQKVRAKYPDASPAEIEAHAKKLMIGISEHISGKKNNNENNSGQQRTRDGTPDVDWDEFAGINLDTI